MSFDAREVANFFLDCAVEQGAPLTNMSLLKLVYFAHGWHLTYFNEPLVKNRFEAWEYGPVVRVIYDHFKEFGDQPILDRATKFDPITQTHSNVEYSFSEELRKFLRGIFHSYAHMHAFRLSEITHETGSPWDAVWNQDKGAITPGMRIHDKEIRNHFASLPNRFFEN